MSKSIIRIKKKQSSSKESEEQLWAQAGSLWQILFMDQDEPQFFGSWNELHVSDLQLKISPGYTTMGWKDKKWTLTIQLVANLLKILKYYT